MKTNLEKLIELYTKYKPEIEVGKNKNGEYGNNFKMLYAYKKLRENSDELLNELVDFDIKSESGVYMIEDYYIGESEYSKSNEFEYETNGIRNRVAGHLAEMFYYHWNKHFNEMYDGEWDDVRYNYLKTNKMWQSFIENDGLKVTQLSENALDEVDLINEYLDKGYPLQNPQQLIERYEKQLSSNLQGRVDNIIKVLDENNGFHGKILPHMNFGFDELVYDNLIDLQIKYTMNSLKEHRNWNIGNIYINNYDYVRLFKTYKNDKVSLYHKYVDGHIDMDEFLHKCDLNKIKYRIYDRDFINFDKFHRKLYEEISDEQINKYKI